MKEATIEYEGSKSGIAISNEYPDIMSEPVAMEERDKYIFLNGYETAIQDMLDYLSVLKSWEQLDTVKVQELLEWLRRENKKRDENKVKSSEDGV